MGTSSTATGRELGDSEGFVEFFRRYTKTWIHGVSTAGLTGFGMLTFVHRWFAVLAIASYVVPPVGLYLTRGRGTSAEADRETDRSHPREPEEADRDRPAPTDHTEEPREPTSGPTERSRAESVGDGDDRSSAGDGAPTATGGDRTSDDDDDDEPAIDDDSDEADREPAWTAVESPTDRMLFDVASTRAGAVAAGGDGVVIASDGEAWTTVLEDGPGADAETLYGVDSTEDGAIAWVAGDNGTVGRLEVDTGRHVDHSAPNDLTDNLTGIAVSGTEGDETVLLINGSGEVLRGRYRDGDLTWESPVKPGSGSSLSDVALAGEVGYCCDTNDGVFVTEDGGRTFDRIGLEDVNGTLTALGPTGRDDCLVATDAGVAHRYDGSAWTPERVGENALTGIARKGERAVACDDAGGVSERDDLAADWERIQTTAQGPLHGVDIVDEWAVAVGDGGEVLECR